MKMILGFFSCAKAGELNKINKRKNILGRGRLFFIVSKILRKL
jgi:hypothetical protein